MHDATSEAPVGHPDHADPAAHQGTPQAAAVESAEGEDEGEVDLDALREANKRRHHKLPMDGPATMGGGTIYLRAATAERVQRASEDYERSIRKVSKIARGEPLTGRAATERERHKVLLCVMDWKPEKTLTYRDGGPDGEVVRLTPADVSRMTLKEKRTFILTRWLPKMDLTSDSPTETQIDYETFLELFGGVQEASDVAAAELLRLGEDFRLGAGGSDDLGE